MLTKKIIGLIPSRISSTRLYQKPLLEINKIPLVIHTYLRAKLSKKISDLYICCDDRSIYDVAKKYGAKVIMTSKKNKNGTERIAEAYEKINKKYDLIIDIQGDEPLISPKHIDTVIENHLKNLNYDIILPSIITNNIDTPNIVKIVVNQNNEVMYLSRALIPYNFKKKTKNFLKHLSIISFKPSALKKFKKSNESPIEKIEGIELMRALEIGLKVKTINLKGGSFSIDVEKDYLKAKKFMKNDKYFKLYKKFKI